MCHLRLIFHVSLDYTSYERIIVKTPVRGSPRKTEEKKKKTHLLSLSFFLSLFPSPFHDNTAAASSLCISLQSASTTTTGDDPQPSRRLWPTFSGDGFGEPTSGSRWHLQPWCGLTASANQRRQPDLQRRCVPIFVYQRSNNFWLRFSLRLGSATTHSAWD